MDQKTIATAVSSPSDGIGKVGLGPQVRIDIQSLDHGDSAQFRAMLQQYMGGGSGQPGGGHPNRDPNSLGHVMADKARGLATETKKDQQYVSKLLEQATRTGDPLHLMRAMMALNDYQLRVQTISKTVSKAATSIDSLTKLQ